MESIMAAVLKEEKNIKLIVNGVNNGSCFKGGKKHKTYCKWSQ